MVKPKGNAIYTGTSGLVLPVPNKKSFPEEYQDKSRLSYYASLFNTIEINSSFKKIPMQKTVEKWTQEVPEDFAFTFKLSKWITHNKGLTFDPKDVHHFMEAIAATGKKKGCILLQFPGQLNDACSPKLRQLLKLIKSINKKNEWDIAVELRHQCWYDKKHYDLLKKFNAGLVIHDMVPFAASRTDNWSDFIYLRLHGTEKNYRGDYTHDFLKKVADDIRSWRDEGKTVYVYFNNTLGNAVHNLIALNSYIMHL